MAGLPGTYDMSVRQGTVYGIEFEWLNEDETPVNMTGYKIRMHVRAPLQRTLLLEATLENGLFSYINPVQGKFKLRLPATITSQFAIGVYRYDLEVVPASGEEDARALLEGQFKVLEEITKG